MTVSEGNISPQLEQNLLEVFEKKLNDAMHYCLESCARGGSCNAACHMYSVTKDAKHAPAYKMELLRRFYRYYFTRLGKILPWISNAKRFSQGSLEKLAEAAYECTGCRRCAVFCPLGLDPSWMVSTARHITSFAELAPEDIDMVAETQAMKGETVEEYKGTFLKQIIGLEKQIQKELGMETASIKVADVGSKADILYLPIAGAHTILPVAKVFEAAGLNWNLSKFDAANYAYFLGDISRAKPLVEEIIEEAKTIGAKTLVVTECGHAFRIMRHLAPFWFSELPFEVKSIVEVLYELIDKEKIRLDPSVHPERVSYHDPCNLGRNGGVYDAPRQILNQATQEFVELNPNREENWCCGGGGGIVAVEDFEDLRMETGQKKVQQIKESKAKTVVTACENCKAQLEDLSDHYKLNIKVTGVMDIVANALITEK
ncbi:MAG: (Fe-S)-binding protein [Promethearchaeota archaeon]